MVDSDNPPNPDGSPSLGEADRRVLRAELVDLMRAAHKGEVHDSDFDVLRDEADKLGELKHPRRGREPGDRRRGRRGHRGGWQYRLYFGVNQDVVPEHLYWSSAARKPHSAFSAAWSRLQDGHVDTAYQRVKNWVVSHIGKQIDGC